MDNFPEDLNPSLLPTDDCMCNIIYVDHLMPANERYAYVNKRFREIIALRCKYAVIQLDEIQTWALDAKLFKEVSALLMNFIKRFPGRVEYKKYDGECFAWHNFTGDEKNLYYNSVQCFRIEIYKDSRKNKIQTFE